MTPQEAARDAAVFADALARHLLSASSPFVSRDEQRACMVESFRDWPALCRRMSELELLAPNCAEAGYEAGAKLLEIVERRAEERAA